MDRKMGAGIAVVVALVVGLMFFMLVRQRAMAQAQAEAERASAEAAMLRSEEALGRGNKVPAEARPPRWEYRVLSIEGGDEAVNQAISKLTEDRWEYVGVVQPASGPQGVYAAKMLFKRMKR